MRSGVITMRCCLFAAQLVVLAGLAGHAHAQGAESSKASGASSDYQRLIHDALQEYDAGHWAEARALFGRAHDLSPSARTLRAMGNADFELRHYVAALRELKAALDDTRNPLSAAQRNETARVIERARSYVGSVRIEVEPEDAELLLEGDRVEGRELTLDSGDYTLVARAQGYQDGEAHVSVQGGQTRTISLHLVPIDLAVKPAPDASTPAMSAARDTPQRDTEGGSILEQWWFWTAAGVLVAGGVATVLIATHDPGERKPEHGTAGLVQVLRVQVPR